MSRWDRRNDDGQHQPQRQQHDDKPQQSLRSRMDRSRSRSRSPDSSGSSPSSGFRDRSRSRSASPVASQRAQQRNHRQQEEERRRRQEALESRGRNSNGTGTGPGGTLSVGKRNASGAPPSGSLKPPIGGIQMKLAAPSSKEPPKLMRPIANAFRQADDDSEPEEMPAECRMRMRNIGRETPTSSGPNSFGKTKHGFCDSKKMFEKKVGSSLGGGDR
ncbi:PEST proteolytic signal-containing nuclear protein-like [Anopheles bellator]|uniref:PEST proteolytic signal-containing nuclear protein-like n=1 Tax=Anopheles bellator TaxID=139047 RepID=UPI002649B6FB|nr:PEST proteolytic signal-containing nuclear protein-like [Anopheles bellator]